MPENEPTTLIPRADFASAIKAKYPVYQDIEDEALITAITDRHPVYRNLVVGPTKTGLFDRMIKGGAPAVGRMSDLLFDHPLAGSEEEEPVDQPVDRTPFSSFEVPRDLPSANISPVPSNVQAGPGTLPSQLEPGQDIGGEAITQFANTVKRVQAESDLARLEAFPIVKDIVLNDDRGRLESLVPEQRKKVFDTEKQRFVNPPRTRTDDFSTALVRGNLNMKLDTEAYSISVTKDGAGFNDVLKAVEKMELLEKNDPTRTGGFVRKGIVATGEMIPGVVKGSVAGFGTGVAAAGGTAAVGQAVPLPEELITVPGAYRVGKTVGAAQFWFRQGAGSMYTTMRRAGMDHDTASIVSQAAGVPYAAIEFSQVGKMVPGLKRGLNKAATTVVRRSVKEMTKRYGARWATEVGEEVLQEFVQILAFDVAGALENELKGKNFERLPFRDQMIRMYDTAKQSAIPMMLLLAPRSAAEARAAIAQRRSEEDALKRVEHKQRF